MARESILIVEDDEDIQELIAFHLAKEGFQVNRTGSGEEALKTLRAGSPHLIILDLMLPGMDGFEVCRRLKADPMMRRIPIVMLTAKGEEADVVTGLELGADDYMPKPFRPRELVARIRAVLRRPKGTADEARDPVRLGDLEIDPQRREVHARGKALELTYSEFEILLLLARHPGCVFTRYQIVDAIRGESYPVTDRAVDVQIVGLRRKLGKAEHYIDTVRGVGYRFKA